MITMIVVMMVTVVVPVAVGNDEKNATVYNIFGNDFVHNVLLR